MDINDKSSFLNMDIGTDGFERLFQMGAVGVMLVIVIIYVYFLHKVHSKAMSDVITRLDNNAKEARDIAKENQEVIRENSSAISAFKTLVETLNRN